MSRRRQAEVRPVQPDLVYSDVVVSALINRIMVDGKKNLASRIFYGACKVIQDKSGNEPLKVFKTAFDNIKPRVEVRSRRVGGSTYQVPVDVSARRQQSAVCGPQTSCAAHSEPARHQPSLCWPLHA